MNTKRIVLPNKILNRALVRSRQEITAGPYIRAVVNCYGRCWLEHLVVEGKPFYDHDPNSRHSPWKIFVKGNRSVSGKDNRYFAGTLIGYNGAQAFKFSNRVWNILNAALSNQTSRSTIRTCREFCDLLRPKPFTDKEWEGQVLEWENMKRLDETFYESMRDCSYEREQDQIAYHDSLVP